MRKLRVGILGGGPAGLYAAILLRLSGPGHEVTVVERNPAGATFGFGVVLSDRTLGAFGQADPISHAAITAHQVTWDALETVHRGRRIRCGGHHYLGIGRKRLLDILQKRCEELGVRLRFETELPDAGALTGCDLVIAADGVNSSSRGLQFGPRVERSRSRYIWLGAEHTPDAFTFLFHETEHGLFQAHLYPYDREMSTCIVQCREETWERAGLERLSEEESVAYCRELLRPYLGDVRFHSNRSLWSRFLTVQTDRWSHGNLVLIGDSAHSAHWSIGSGTKLAMEDAIALVGALDRHPDIPDALAAYEAERRPAVEQVQRAGRISEQACENIDRVLHLPPPLFAFHLMTRSERVDYARLRRLDPGFIEQVDACFGGRQPAHGHVVTAEDLLLVRPVGDPMLAYDGARSIWPATKPVALALPEIDPGLAGALRDRGCSLIWVDDPRLSERIRLEAGVATVVPARDLDHANTLIAGARADLCFLDPSP